VPYRLSFTVSALEVVMNRPIVFTCDAGAGEELPGEGGETGTGGRGYAARHERWSIVDHDSVLDAKPSPAHVASLDPPSQRLKLFVSCTSSGVDGLQLGVGGHDLTVSGFRCVQPHDSGHGLRPAAGRCLEDRVRAAPESLRRRAGPL